MNTLFLANAWRFALLTAVLVVSSVLPAIRVARASEAVIHFQVGEAKEDQNVTITLFDQEAPATVENFKKLASTKFYKGLMIHRIVPETLVQMGDPLSRGKDRSRVGTGGPEYTLPSEVNRHKHMRGAVAMAALPETLNPAHASNGSQFYIILQPQPALDKDYTVFGEVTAGLDFLDSISRRGRDTNDYPLEKVTIRSIDVR